MNFEIEFFKLLILPLNLFQFDPQKNKCKKICILEI
ncbi:putative signal peptide protein [Puccinia sorghi]|uniref:Putative signal peptide protein n=1 Tax=Puccinia sorghi TaxID=27349 RepID=A0A0L6UHK7_9BASI|nr:putative signal peptide protein [Puccinia sorghi]